MVCAAVLFAAIALGSASASAAGDAGTYLPEQMAVNPLGQPVITPDQADGLVRAVWTARAAAFTYGIAELTNTYETLSAAEFDDNADPSIYGRPGAITAMTLILTRQMTFPASFIAVVTTSDPGRHSRREGIVMSRPDARAPWKLAIDTVFYPGADDLAPLIGDDGYARAAPGPLDIRGADPHEFYTAGLTDGSEVACYALRWPDSKENSWLLPRHVTRSDYLRPGYYTTTTGHRLWQACAFVPTFASGSDSRLLGELDGFVAMSASTEPPPWLLIGLIGVALVSVAYILLVWLRPSLPGTTAPTSAVAAFTPTTPPVKRIGTVLWQNALLGLVVMSIEAAILIEIIQSLAMVRVELGLALLVLAIAWVLVLLPPWLRRDRAMGSVIIPASPHAVWAALADLSVSLDPEIVSVERTSTGKVGVGSTFREVQQVTKGPQVEFVSVITTYEPGRELAIGYPQLWHRQAHRTVVAPDGAGTLVTRTHELTMSPTLAIVGGILFARQLRQPTHVNLRQWLRQLHQRVTGTDGSGAEAVPPARGRGLLAGLGVGLAVMVGTALLSLGGYALLFGVTLGALIMAILLIHELGHFAEARRSGLAVRLPFFIPFIGAAVTMKAMPGDAGTHARIAFAGPLIGTLAVAAAFLAAAPTNSSGVLFFAQLCALINLVNLIPIGILDGGSILAPISRWISVVGLVLAVGLVGLLTIAGQFSPLLLVIVGVTALLVVNRFRQHRTPYYRNVGRRMQFIIGAIWLAAIAYLIFAVVAATQGLLLS